MSESAGEAVAPDARPLVARPVSDRSLWLFAGVMGVAALGLFAALEARRGARSDPALLPEAGQSASRIEPPPPLAVPDATVGSYGATGAAWPNQFAAAPATLAPAGPAPVVRVVPRIASPGSASPFAQVGSGPTYPSSYPLPAPGPALVYQAPPAATTEEAARVATSGPERIKAARFDNPSTTIPQGSVVHAVLETALDSTRPGSARAIVSNDVRGFDGTRILIPRGSRLYGEYKADLSSGQNRAMIQWTRLMRPDGVVISLDSPSADPLGRAGVKGKVNSHFLSRFGEALLQTSLNLGVNLATRDIGGGTLVLGLPGSTQNVTSGSAASGAKPTLSVAQGTPVSVFVAHDLDFTGVEQ